jgi:hypothetical protein
MSLGFSATSSRANINLIFFDPLWTQVAWLTFFIVGGQRLAAE